MNVYTCATMFLHILSYFLSYTFLHLVWRYFFPDLSFLLFKEKSLDCIFSILRYLLLSNYSSGSLFPCSLQTHQLLNLYKGICYLHKNSLPRYSLPDYCQLPTYNNIIYLYIYNHTYRPTASFHQCLYSSSLCYIFHVRQRRCYMQPHILSANLYIVYIVVTNIGWLQYAYILSPYYTNTYLPFRCMQYYPMYTCLLLYLLHQKFLFSVEHYFGKGDYQILFHGIQYYYCYFYHTVHYQIFLYFYFHSTLSSHLSFGIGPGCTPYCQYPIQSCCLHPIRSTALLYHVCFPVQPSLLQHLLLYHVSNLLFLFIFLYLYIYLVSYLGLHATTNHNALKYNIHLCTQAVYLLLFYYVLVMYMVTNI
ncbi:p360 1L [African swine fever virus]|uniref:p360 1L n=1 Tax=African swine fever virus TaxID=10497 RepID=A0A894KSS2_ASF|nr:p360 1L [African swine fever virus]